MIIYHILLYMVIVTKFKVPYIKASQLSIALTRTNSLLTFLQNQNQQFYKYFCLLIYLQAKESNLLKVLTLRSR